MKFFEKLNTLFSTYLGWIVLGVAIAALSVPQTFLWASGYTTLFLQLVMFCMGLTMKPSDFSQVFKQPRQVFLVTIMQFGWMPLSALLISRLFQLSPEMTLGLLLVGCVPGGTSSNVITYLANGNVPLSITATSISTLCAPVLTPLFLSLYGGAYLEMSFASMFLSIIKVVLVPILGGLLLNHFFHGTFKKVEKTLPTFSSIAVLIVLGGTVALNRENLLQTGAVVFLFVWLHNFSGYLFSYVVCRFLKIDRAATRAMAVEVGTQNTALAASLALQHFSPISALAGAAGTIVGTLFGSVYANVCRLKDARPAAAVKSANQ